MNINNLTMKERNIFGIFVLIGILLLPITVGLLFKHNYFEIAFVMMIFLNGFFFIIGYLTKEAKLNNKKEVKKQ